MGLIPFAALRLADGRYLVQRQQVAILQTGRDLKSSLPERTAGNLLVAFGGVDYGKISPAEITKAKDDDGANLLNMRAARELEDMKYLEHSLHEANTIASLFKTNRKDGKTVVYKGKEATEGRLKSLEQPPMVLHLSTHGYFLASGADADWAAETPLLLSGLALAGANQGLHGAVDENGEDGLLYGLEALGLNLQGTELVSLSACNTGEGVVDYSEGVYGLVQAFRAAGARNVLMTLQPVGDQSSRTFMEKFYEIWLGSRENLTPSEAMHQTRLYFINHEKPEYRAPEMWSPYVLVGN